MRQTLPGFLLLKISSEMSIKTILILKYLVAASESKSLLKLLEEKSGKCPILLKERNA